MDSSLYLTRAQVRAIDRLAVEEYGLPAVILMENAGRGAAQWVLEIARERRSRGCADTPVAVVCGRGNNGGDGYVVARHVANEGWPVELFATDPAERLPADAQIMRRVVERMGLAVHDVGDEASLARAGPRLAAAGIVVDALLGTGFQGEVRPELARIIESINALRADYTSPIERTVVALDVPSGLDCDRGEPSNATLIADVTVTFVARKQGFSVPQAARYLGRVEVVSIGVPRAVMTRARAVRG